jgi:pSer/pThr/pTyr-binding forkhead associated (FHA) protein
MVTTCSACGSEVEPGAVKCPSCGTQLTGGTASMPVVDGEDRSAVLTEVGPAAKPSLVIVKGPDAGERFVLDRARLAIGRDPDDVIFLNDVTVSREHAVVTVSGSDVTIADRGSLNGTYVNGVIIEEAKLSDGDHVQIGRFVLVFFTGVGA